MAKSSTAAPAHGKTEGRAASLDTLNRTLEDLEARLDRLVNNRANAKGEPAEGKPADRARPAAARKTSPDLSDAVSQIEGRRRDLERDETPVEDRAPARRPRGSRRDAAAREPRAPDADMIAKLQKLRTELADDMARSLEPRFADMRAAVEDLRGMIGEQARPDAIRAEIDRVDQRLEAMGAAGADTAAVDELRRELAAMGEALGETAREASVQDINRHWETLRSDLTRNAQSEDQHRRDIRQDLERLRESVAGLAREEDLRAVEARWSALEDRIADRGVETQLEAMGERMAKLETQLTELPETFSVAPLEERIHALALGIEAIARQQEEEPDAEQFRQIDERLDEISRAIVAATNRPAPIDPAGIERIEARLQGLAAQVESLAEGDETEALTARVGALAERLEAQVEAGPSPEMAERMERFAERLESMLEAAETGSNGLETRVDALSERVEAVAETVNEQRVDPALVESLKIQIAGLSTQLADSLAASTAIDPEMEARLAAIERRLETDRADVVAVARQAADEAIRQMLASGDFSQSTAVTDLSEDLRALEALARETQAQGQDYHDSVEATLRSVMDRIDRMERDLRLPAQPHDNAAEDQAGDSGRGRGLKGVFARAMGGGRSRGASAGAAAGAASVDPTLDVAEPREPAVETEAPSLDAADILHSQEADRPLDVGSGAPDVSALLARVRAQQSEGEASGPADFIAAARRAATAAAEEAKDQRDGVDDTDDDATGSRSWSARRRPLMLAGGAVLLALLAIPAARTLAPMIEGEATNEAVVENGERVAMRDVAPPAAVEDEPAGDPAAGAANDPVEAAEDAPPAPEASPAELSDEAAGDTAPATPGVSPTQTAAITPSSPADADEARTMSPMEAAHQARRENAGPNPLMAPTALTPPVAARDEGTQASAPAVGPTRAAAARNDTAGQGTTATASAGGSLAAGVAIPEGVANAALSEAARDGQPKALFEIGLRLMEGRQAAPDPGAAAGWFERAGVRGYAPAQYSLGTLYEKGNGVERDTATARDWYLKAADSGNVRAMHNLAVLYATGVDGQSEPELAAKWFETAARHGMTDSQYNLGILHARGAGVDQDLVASYKWFALVAEAGDADAGDKRDEIAKSLTEDQLAAAKAQVAAFKPEPRADKANVVEIPPAWRGADAGTDPIQSASVDKTRAIRNIQTILSKLGYEPGPADGVMGERTTAAITAFQREADLEPSGKVDEALIRALLERRQGGGPSFES